jgi:DNA repair exonuclease SbcCD ATPase subunit
MTEYTNISEEINKLKSNLAKLEDIVNKANTAKENKRNLLKEAK